MLLRLLHSTMLLKAAIQILFVSLCTVPLVFSVLSSDSKRSLYPKTLVRVFF